MKEFIVTEEQLNGAASALNSLLLSYKDHMLVREVLGSLASNEVEKEDPKNKDSK